MKEQKNKQDVIIIGAGPAGLAAAQKLAGLGKTVTLFDKDSKVGGLSKTINYKGFLFDMGPHRFFSKSKEVNDLWENTLGEEFLRVSRLTRIYYNNKFFHYPLKPFNALFGLGILASANVLASYIKSRLYPYKEEKNFEQWVSNRFGKKLYEIFFKNYTEKLWGIPCTEIQAEWAAQRIKGLSLSKAVINAIYAGENKIKTLVDEFRYPKFGAGMVYEKIADDILKNNGKINLCHEVSRINHNGENISSVVVQSADGEKEYFSDHFLSSMPINLLVEGVSPDVPQNVARAAQRLKYRSTLIVNLILDSKNPFPDNWIYVHSPNSKAGRILSLKNFSSYTVPDKSKTALGLEYFCNENDDFWEKDDRELIEIGIRDLENLNLAKKSQYVDGIVLRMPKTYPVYDRGYSENIKIIRNCIGKFKNLQLIGRYGMFKYNNMDHSILTGLRAAENILGGWQHDIWNINADQEYQEEGK